MLVQFYNIIFVACFSDDKLISPMIMINKITPDVKLMVGKFFILRVRKIIIIQ